MRGAASAREDAQPASAHLPIIEPPPSLVQATRPAQLAALLPSSYPIAAFRRRSIEARGVRVSYVPHFAGEDPGSERGASSGEEDGSAPRAPSASYLEVVLPFSSNPSLRDEYERFRSGRLRLGLVLEDVDSLAADIAARHLAGSGHDVAVITASMDKLQLVTHEQHLAQLKRASATLPRGTSEHSEEAHDVPAAPAAGAGGEYAMLAGQPGALPPLDPAGRAALSSSVVEAPPGSPGVSGGPLLVDHDLRLAGCVAWVGRSSLEVVIEMADRPPMGGPATGPTAAQDGDPAAAASADHAAAGSGGWRRRGVAQFVMVVRGGTKERPLRARPLAPAAPWEVKLCAHAAARQEARRAKRAAEAAAAPAAIGGGVAAAAAGLGNTDAALLGALVLRAGHARAEAWRRTHAAAGGGEGAPVSGVAPVPMSATSLRAPVIMHYQDRNITNAIFGGHILRSAYEAAYAAAALHAGVHPEPLSMSDVSFKQPVTVGSIVEFDAKVVLTHGDLMRVAVQAIKFEPAHGVPCSGGGGAAGGTGTGAEGSSGGALRGSAQQALTTTFSFLFAAPCGAPVPPVAPESLADAAEWLDAARQHADDGYPAAPVAALLGGGGSSGDDGGGGARARG